MARTQKKQHDSTPLHVRWSFPWWFRALLHGGPPLFISSFLFFRSSFYFCHMKPTGTEKNILPGGAGPLAGWLPLRISLESSPRAALIGPSSSSTTEARTALATAPLFLTWGLGLVLAVLAFLQLLEE